jgi:hypothetical protein
MVVMDFAEVVQVLFYWTFARSNVTPDRKLLACSYMLDSLCSGTSW